MTFYQNITKYIDLGDKETSGKGASFNHSIKLLMHILGCKDKGFLPFQHFKNEATINPTVFNQDQP